MELSVLSPRKNQCKESSYLSRHISRKKYIHRHIRGIITFSSRDVGGFECSGAVNKEFTHIVVEVNIVPGTYTAIAKK